MALPETTTEICLRATGVPARYRTPLALSKDATVSRLVQQLGKGRIVEIPEVGTTIRTNLSLSP